MRFSRAVRTGWCLFLSTGLLLQGCLSKKGGSGSALEKGASSAPWERPSVPTADKARRGGLAITSPQRGFVNQPVTLVQGIAPVGAKVLLFDGPTLVGQGTSDEKGMFSIAVGSLGEGPHFLRADADGSGSSAGAKVVVDTTPPSVSFVQAPASTIDEPYALLRWNASEEFTLFSTKLDSQSASAFTLVNQMGLTALSPGIHAFTVVARDLAGNQSAPVSTSFTYTLPSHEKLSNLLITPNPFNPLEEGIGISTAMADGIVHPWTIEIKNGSGTLIRSFSGNGTSLSATWDGKNASGVPQAVGTYQAYIIVEGVSGSFPLHVSSWKAGYLNQDIGDLKLSAPGIALELNRRYRSDRAGESGSFGRGHFSDVLDTKITIDYSKLPVTFKTPSEQKMTFPFKREFAGATGHYKATWAAPEGHLFKDRFAPAYVLDLGGDFLDPDLNDYRPKFFDWTQRDKDQIGFSVDQGMEYQRDPNGNQITYTPTAINHSNGRAIALVRDDVGRITQMKDPNGNTWTYAYDTKGRLVATTDPSEAAWKLEYDTAHRLTAQTTSSGTLLGQYAFDSTGNPTIARDSQSHAFGFFQGPNQDRMADRTGMRSERGFNADGTLARVVSPLGDETRYTYNAQKLPTEIQHPLGQVESLTYSSQGDITQHTDRNGNTSEFTYDSVGHILTHSTGRTQWSYSYDEKGNLLSKKETTPEGTTTSVEYTYDSKGNVLVEKHPSGATTTHAYDAAGNRTKTVYPDGSVAEYTYDANGNRTSEKRISPNQGFLSSVVTTYDARNRVKTIESPSFRVELERDEFGNITTAKKIFPNGATEVESFTTTPRGDGVGWKGANGRKREYTPDPDGRVLVERIDGEIVAYHRYDELGRLIITLTPQGDFERWAYDALSRVIEHEGSEVSLGRSTYDAKGRIATQTTEGITESYSYDANGKVTSITQTDGVGSRVSTYDAGGRLISVTDSVGTVTSYTYDATGNLLKVSRPNPAGGSPLETTYTYDDKGNRLTQRDAKGRTTSWTYDAGGRVTSRTLPMGQREQFFYNTEGQLTQHRKFDGSLIAYAYTAGGKLSKKVYPDGSSVMWVYDPDDRLVEILDYRGSTKRVYDERGKLAAVVDPKKHILNYDYDPSGKVTRLGLSSGQTRYGFDDQGRLWWIEDPSGKITRYGYESKRRARVDHGNGTVEEFGYDAGGRLVRLTHKDSLGKALREFHYTRDAAGRVAKVVEESGRIVEYTYDISGRVTKEKASGSGEITYEYDEVGNRLKKTAGSAVTNYQYDANDRLMKETAGAEVIAYEFDSNGNTIARNGGNGGAIYQYDDEDRLRGAQVGVMSLGFAYDPEGTRTGKIVNGLPIDFVVDTNRTYSQVVAEYHAGQLYSMVATGDWGEKGNEVVSILSGLNRYEFHHDGANRSVRMVTDAAQNIVEKRDYDAFGNLLGISGTGAGGMGLSPGLDPWGAYGFAGEEYDAHLGMSTNRARYYDARIGRFPTMDPWSGNAHDPISRHRYLYAHNDPVNRTDPSGRFTLFEVLTTMSVMNRLAGIVQTNHAAAIQSAHLATLTVHGYAVNLAVRQHGDLEETDAGIVLALLIKNVDSMGASVKAILDRIPSLVRRYYAGAGRLGGTVLKGPAAEGFKEALRAGMRAALGGRSMFSKDRVLKTLIDLEVFYKDTLKKIEERERAFQAIWSDNSKFSDLCSFIHYKDEFLMADALSQMRNSRFESIRKLADLLEAAYRNRIPNVRLSFYDAETVWGHPKFGPAYDFLSRIGGFVEMRNSNEETKIWVFIKGNLSKDFIAAAIAHEAEHLVDKLGESSQDEAIRREHRFLFGSGFYGYQETEIHAYLTTMAFLWELGLFQKIDHTAYLQSLYKTYPSIAEALYNMVMAFREADCEEPPIWYKQFEKKRVEFIEGLLQKLLKPQEQ